MRSRLFQYLAAIALWSAATAYCAFAQPAARFDRNAWLADYQSLKTEIERSYSHLAWFASPEGGVDLPALDREAERALRQASSDAEASAAIQAFVRGFHDGHFTSAALVPTPPTPAPEPPRPASYTDAATACAAYGYAPVNRVAFSLPFETLEGFSLNSDGISEAFRTGIVESDGLRIGVIRIARFRASEFASLCIEAWSAVRDRGASLSLDAVTAEANVIWLRTLGARLLRFRQQRVVAVVVDIGGNGGGNDLGDWAVRAFTAAPVRSAPLLVTTGPAGLPYLDEQIANLQATLAESRDLPGSTRRAIQHALDAFQHRKERASRAPCDMSWVWREQRAWTSPHCTRLTDAGFASGQYDYVAPSTFDDRAAGALYWASIADAVRGSWDGRTYVLTNGQTGSSAEMFAALMQDRGVARIIGAHTLGLGCGFMDAGAPATLPRARLSFAIPNCVRLRADGADDVAGVAPDLPLIQEAGESARAHAARAFATIARDLAQGPTRAE